jgi:hypothetical protein
MEMNDKLPFIKATAQHRTKCYQKEMVIKKPKVAWDVNLKVWKPSGARNPPAATKGEVGDWAGLVAFVCEPPMEHAVVENDGVSCSCAQPSFPLPHLSRALASSFKA